METNTFSHSRTKLYHRIVALYGEESIFAKQFIEMCKSFPNNLYSDYWDRCLIAFVEAHETDPQKIE